jgi:hypothetical protein
MYGAAADESAWEIAQVARLPSECPARGLTATSADAACAFSVCAVVAVAEAG